MTRINGYLVGLSVALGAACGGSDNNGDDGGSGAASSSSIGGSTTSAGGGGTSSSSLGGAGGMLPQTVSDPNLDGPYQTATLDDSINVPATGNNVGIHCVYPSSGPSAGPYPVVLVGHGFQLPPSQYASYLQRLASFGYVALTVDFVAGFVGVNNVEQAQELLAGLDWAQNVPELAGKANSDVAGASGHSLGGKVALLAATMDARIKATITLDPVDGAMNCSPQNCPDVSELLPLAIPTGFLGETLDATGSFQACAPAADNFDTFFSNASAPSLKVDVLGANHMSFLDNVSSCGLPCTFCNMATLDNATVNALSRAFMVAFYERYLKGNTGYDSYLTGAEAQMRYVDTGLVSLTSK